MLDDPTIILLAFVTGGSFPSIVSYTRLSRMNGKVCLGSPS